MRDGGFRAPAGLQQWKARGLSALPPGSRPRVNTYFDVLLNSTAVTNESWVTQAAELTDATGNVLSSSGVSSASSLNLASPMGFLGESPAVAPGNTLAG